MDTDLRDGGRKEHARQLGDRLNEKFRCELREWKKREMWKRAGVRYKVRAWMKKAQTDGIEGLQVFETKDEPERCREEEFSPAARAREMILVDLDDWGD